MRKPLAATFALGAALLPAACGGGTPQPLAPAEVPAAFIAVSQAADRTMHMEWTGTYAMGGRGAVTTPFTATLDFAGENFAGTVSSSTGSLEGKPGDTTVQIAMVDGQTYQWLPYSNGWQTFNNGMNGVALSLDPMRGLTTDKITYVGQEVKDGATVHHLRVTDLSVLANGLFATLSGGLLGDTQFATEDSSFDVYVDETAHPVSAAINLSTSAQPNDFGAISMNSTYAFSNWGAEIYIVAPPVVNQPDQPCCGGGVPVPMPKVMP